MTWTGTEAPHGGADDAGLPTSAPTSSPPWEGWEPLAPGALGAPTAPARQAGADPTSQSGLFADLPPLPLTGPLADALHTTRTALDDATTAACYLSTTGAHQRVEAIQRIAEARDLTDAVLLRLLATFTPDDLRTVGATNLVDLVLTHTGSSPQRANTEVKLAAALTAPPQHPLTEANEGDQDDDGDATADSDADADPDTAADSAEDAAGPAAGPAAGLPTGPAAGPAAGSSAVALGLLGEAHAAGRLSTDVASLAQRTIASLPARIRREHGATADATLARSLPGLTHAQAAIVCTTLAHTLDPDRADRGFDPEDLDRQYLNVTVHADGTVEFRGRLDPVAGAEFKAAIDAASKPLPTVHAPVAPIQSPDQSLDQMPGQEPLDGLDADGDRDGRAGGGFSGDSTSTSTANAGATGGGAGAPAGGAPAGGAGAAAGGAAGAGSVPVRDLRPAPLRRAHAFAELVRLARGSDGTIGGEGARVIVTTSEQALAGTPGAEPGHCETTNRSLSTAALRMVACTGSLQAVVLSCEGADAKVLALGRAVRLFTAGQRRAMLARDGGCAIPGCTAPPGMLEAHHVWEWAAGGLTDVDSGVLLCIRHHILVTLGVWGVRMVDGVPQIRPPRAVDPLQRWVINPRRSLREQTVRQLELAIPAQGRRAGSGARRAGAGGDPPGPSGPPPPSPPQHQHQHRDPSDIADPDVGVDAGCPDISSRHGTCEC
ncbi:HNH endonuclease signature motif containing protein [Quadrisphaera granulorum]|nr:HNH endonuclease signature motif containing protein [Quadrisphaera granulorum]